MDRTKFVPWDDTNCLDLCKKVLDNYGMSSYGSSGNVIQVATSGSGTIKPSGSNPAQTLKDAVECLDRHLDANRVIIVGVDYNPDISPNTDGTDHFIVVTGRGYDFSRGGVTLHTWIMGRVILIKDVILVRIACIIWKVPILADIQKP